MSFHSVFDADHLAKGRSIEGLRFVVYDPLDFLDLCVAKGFTEFRGGRSQGEFPHKQPLRFFSILLHHFLTSHEVYASVSNQTQFAFLADEIGGSLGSLVTFHAERASK